MSDPYAPTWQDEARLWDRYAALGTTAQMVARVVYSEALKGEQAAEIADGLMDALADVDPEGVAVARLMWRCGTEDRAELANLEREQ